MAKLTEGARYRIAEACRTASALCAEASGRTDEKVKFPGWDYGYGDTATNNSIRAAAYAIYNGDTSYDDYTEVSLQDLARLLRYVGDMVDFM